MVMPSTTPSVAASRISLRLAVSRKIFMIPTYLSDARTMISPAVIAAEAAAHGRLASTGSVGSLSLPAWSKAVTVYR